MDARRTQLLEKIDLLNEELKALKSTLQNHNNEKLNSKKDENTWSPIQVMHHLILSETLSLKYCKKKLSFNPELKNINLKSRFNSALLSFYLNVPIKIKAPAMVGSSALPESDTLENTYNRWLSLREELKEFIRTVDEKYLETEVYKHPFGMRISISGMLSFYRAHFRRHRKQIMKILKY